MTASAQPNTGSPAANFGIVAWIIYNLGAVNGYWSAAALGGLIVALLIVGHEYRRNAVKIMDCVALGFFTFALVTTVLAGPALFEHYNVFAVWAIFAMVAWITLAIGQPFTIQYAREQAPPTVWHHPLFRRLNLTLTLVWALILSLNAALGLIAFLSGRLLLFGVILPVSTLIFAFVFSARYPKRFEARFAELQAAS